MRTNVALVVVALTTSLPLAQGCAAAHSGAGVAGTGKGSVAVVDETESRAVEGSGVFDVSARDRREDCVFAAGALPSETLDPDEPHGANIPIEHFIVIMQENRSFDHYFEMLPERGQPDADVAPKNFSNPDPSSATGAAVAIFHQSIYCLQDIHHGWNRMHKQYAHGAMSGFVASANPDGRRAMGYYDESDLPYYYGLATTFSIADRYFSDVMGPTLPNRNFAVSGSSFGVISDNAPAAGPKAKTIFQQLQEAGINWTIYSDKPTLEEEVFPFLRSEYAGNFASIATFLRDAKAGSLPALAWVESKLVLSAVGEDEHPPSDVQIGQRFVAQLVDAVMNGPAWPSAAIFISYDEHGGFFDHVPPPPACVPDSTAPQLSKNDVAGGFDRYGMRVPLIVVSPFAKAHHVSHDILSHASILRLVQARYELGALSARDANARPPYDLFDFDNPPFLTPPVLPTAFVDETELSRCEQLYP